MAKIVKDKAGGAKDFADDEILLGVLTAVDRDSNLSQRHISSELGVALGLANAYLRRCVRKGLIKIHQVPRRRYAYYLTPHGFAEKARLTGQYLSASFTFFRRARQQMSEIVEICSTRGWRRVALAGVSELAEVATLCARDHDVTLVGIVDSSYRGQSFGGLRVFENTKDFDGIDAVVITSLTEPEQVYRAMQAEVGSDRVFAPRLLRIKQVAESMVLGDLPSEAAE